MTKLKRLVHEVHRRSLWQVVGIYGATSWIVLQVVETLSETIGVPEWFGPVAFALLLLGLPIVVATAFVQEGMGTSGSSGGGLSAETSSRSPAGFADAGAAGETETAPRSPSGERAAAAGSPRPPPRSAGRHRLFTWRNAILGGLAAFALLGLATGGYLAMRSLGIGPAGTLVAKGVIEEGVEVVLADFESADAELADVVTGALRIDLVESPTIQLVPRSELEEALSRMQRSEDAPITGQVARELAEREGYGAVIEGNVGTAGSGYVLTASIVGGEDWEALAGFRATARNEDELIDAIEELSRDIREKAGESLRSVRRSPPLDQVTTTSLEALRTYTRAAELEGEEDREGALELYERAVTLDSTFAMAHRKIGVLLSNMGLRRQDEVAALTRAYQLRERLPERERLQAEAFYHMNVTGDRDAVIRTYEALLDAAPEDRAALNNLALMYYSQGRPNEAERLLERAVEVEAFAVGYENLARARARTGDADGAEAALDSGVSSLPEAAFALEEFRVQLAAARGRHDGADSMVAAYAERFQGVEATAASARLRFQLDALRGRFRSAESNLEYFDAAPDFWANPVARAYLRTSLALTRGDSAAAARLALEAHENARASLPAADRRQFLTIEILVDAGRVEEAERLLGEWRDQVPDEELGVWGREDRRGSEARLAFARGNVEESARLWNALRRECPGRPPCFLGAALGLARIHEAAGDAGAAIAEYERFLSEPFLDRTWFDARDRGRVLERLGQLYDEQGDLENAARHYAAFVELWADADPPLRPRVEAAQARLQAIVEQRG